MDLGLNQHQALITGAASGIGLATAKLFAQEGCSLTLWDIAPSLEATANELRAEGIEVTANHVDVSDSDQTEQAVSEMERQGQSIQHVVHCAATGSGTFGYPFTNLRPADWRHTLEINIMGMVNVAHALTPPMIRNDAGTFVFLASIAGQIGSQTDPPYSASKAANINFAQCMAKDLAPHNIRVNTVCPGMVKTPLNRSVWQAWNERTAPSERLSYEDWSEQKIKSVVPLGRWQTSEDVAAMIVFLSSERAKEVTGQTVNVDGGFVMHW
ncbi:SDR family oxidoreductase [Roseiconus nitratireducens]|uniref:SDR family oxidoreductase n=1 Tax=Roseiconus nitratireducens TaxID=2605748 RepID=A0A5M6CVH1_9BACT|nr:SDR family oxidoreductase [Roseiconus nitratireducens]KAA5539224.1 SDR family oxidoreductase [Roseiconus nitratireducens]